MFSHMEKDVHSKPRGEPTISEITEEEDCVLIPKQDLPCSEPVLSETANTKTQISTIKKSLLSQQNSNILIQDTAETPSGNAIGFAGKVNPFSFSSTADREKTGSTMFLQRGPDSGKRCDVDQVGDNPSVGKDNKSVFNSVLDTDPAVSRSPKTDPSGESTQSERQRIFSGESQRYTVTNRPARIEGKRHYSEGMQFERDSSSPFKHRGSTDSRGQDRNHEMKRSQSDSTQEVTPETAQTYRAYKEAKRRQQEKEEQEKGQQGQSPTDRLTGCPPTRQDPLEGASRGGLLGESSGPSHSETVSSKFCIVYGADQPSPESTDDRHSDLDIDLDDSDDELLETPSFLRDLENAITQPVPRTPPPKNTASPLPGSPVTVSGGSSSLMIPSASRCAKFSLDSLLEEHTNKPKEQREYEEMHAELKESVKHGGFVKDTLENQENLTPQDLLPEHQEHIDNLEMKKSVINSAHPGEIIFSPGRYMQLYTSSITPAMCGFIPGDSHIDKFLSSVHPRNYSTLLSSEVLINSLERIAHPKYILKWLLCLLSVDQSHLAMDGCYKVLEEYLYCQKVFNQNKDDPWAPAIEDILSVFINFGASKDGVLPPDVFKDEDEFSSLGERVTRETGQPLPPPNAGSLNRENLRMVTQVLALTLQGRPRYSVSHLTALYVMLCRVALDTSLNSGLINIEVQSCLGNILCCYPDSEWKSCVLKLCSVLPGLTDHHHNKAYLASLSPYGERGQFLQRRVAYGMLRQLFDMEPSPADRMENCKIRDLHQFLPHLQNLVNTDMYKLYSCITLIDLSVGNGLITPGEKDSLQYLSEQIKKISGDTRDDVRMLDRSRVKDQMVRLTSKWTLKLLTVGNKQRSIFSYTTSRAPQTLEIETVQTIQTDESQSDPDSDVEMDASDDEELPSTATPGGEMVVPNS
ncbi:SMC5-SMC6 complex localization factor protein 2-like isoform X4 [Crassostrea virginica]